MSPQIKLSDALSGLLRSFEPHVGDVNGAELPQASIISIVAQLRAAKQLARSIEQEVQVLRLVEVARHTRFNMDDLAVDAVLNPARDRQGNVITPNFGRKKP